jgi:hypothetical protein
MPLVCIDVNRGRSVENLRALSHGIHDAILAEYGIPERDYFRIVTEYRAGRSSPGMRASAQYVTGELAVPQK